jgi:hypothetical protein
VQASLIGSVGLKGGFDHVELEPGPVTMIAGAVLPVQKRDLLYARDVDSVPFRFEFQTRQGDRKRMSWKGSER